MCCVSVCLRFWLFISIQQMVIGQRERFNFAITNHWRVYSLPLESIHEPYMKTSSILPSIHLDSGEPAPNVNGRTCICASNNRRWGEQCHGTGERETERKKSFSFCSGKVFFSSCFSNVLLLVAVAGCCWLIHVMRVGISYSVCECCDYWNARN